MFYGKLNNKNERMIIMTTDKINTSIRLPVNLHKKMVYIAKMNYRSLNSELNQAVKKCIKKYEAEHGEILLSESEKIIIGNDSQ